MVLHTLQTPNYVNLWSIWACFKGMALTYSGNPLSCRTAFTLLGNAPTRFWSIAVGICLFSLKSISEVGYYNQRSKCVEIDWGEGSSIPSFSTPSLHQVPYLRLHEFFAPGHYHPRTCLGHLIPVNGIHNTMAYKDIQDNPILSA